MKLHVVDGLPSGFLDAAPEDLVDLLGGPTLIRLEGARRPPLFVSILLHGDETTGLLAVQELLRRHARRSLPRSLSIFVGNVLAARARVRRLPEQPDYNRVWPGGSAADCPESRLMVSVLDELRGEPPFASVDIHNNSGLHPFYSCLANASLESLRLATLFSRIAVYFTEPRGVATGALSTLGPAITVEAGRPGEGVAQAAACLEAVLHMVDFPRHVLAHGDLDLFHTVATVRVPPDVSLSFDGSPADLVFRTDLDHLNFSELPAGTRLAEVQGDGDLLFVLGDGGRNRWQESFAVRDRGLVLRHEAIPAMLTRSVPAVRQDCLCYLMERVEAPAHGN